MKFMYGMFVQDVKNLKCLKNNFFCCRYKSNTIQCGKYKNKLFKSSKKEKKIENDFFINRTIFSPQSD